MIYIFPPTETLKNVFNACPAWNPPQMSYNILLQVYPSVLKTADDLMQIVIVFLQ